ncbi:MAG: hypothetical protein H6573_11595 [Lewinellaceae bacterium]|nr:hypothetical protein [Lewinellaceae bacterium]
MNQAHVHLLLTHLPIVGSLLGVLVLLAGFAFRSEPVKRTTFGLFLFAALAAIPTFLTGEGAEEVVENLPGVQESLIGRHEDILSIFIWLISGLGLLSLATLAASFKSNSLSKALYAVTLVVSLAAMGVATQVGATGGQIRHTEIGSATAQADAGQEGGGVYGGEQEERDED